MKTTSGPSNRTPEQRMARLRELLAKPNWTFMESAFILAGVDPGENPLQQWGSKPVSSWDLLPGLDRPVNPKKAGAFDTDLIAAVRRCFSATLEAYQEKALPSRQLEN